VVYSGSSDGLVNFWERGQKELKHGGCSRGTSWQCCAWRPWEPGVQRVGGQDDMRVEEGRGGAHMPVGADGAHGACQVPGGGEGRQGWGEEVDGVQWEFG
ncbi:hypothetical protein PHJA_002564600, partial [Phtheirospermum japonicum]